jgi:hypothetical protein
MNPKLRIDVERAAIIGVIQSTSENDHHPDAGRKCFDELELDWVGYKFFDENNVDDFIRGVTQRRFSGVCFGSNALSDPIIHDAACGAAKCFIDASQAGMGIVLLQQFLPEGSRRACNFLPTFHQLEYQGVASRCIDRIQVKNDVLDRAPVELDASVFGDREPGLWSTIEAIHPGAWRHRATVQADRQEHVALMHTRASRGRVIASVLPLDWMSDRRLLAYALRLSVRSLGTLYVRSHREQHPRSIALGPPLSRSLATGGHLSSVTVADPRDVLSKEPPFADFSHLVMSEEFGWPELTGLSYERIRGRLENGGSVVAYGSREAAGSPRVLAIVSGRPAYLQIAHQFAVWYTANSKRFTDAPISHVLALALAVSAVNESIEDKEGEIPLALLRQNVDSKLASYYRTRLRGTDNVDKDVLATVNVAWTMQLLGHPEAEITPLVAWIERGDFVDSFAAMQQAALWRSDLHMPPDREPESDLEEIYDCLLAVKATPSDPSKLDRLLEILKNPETQVGRRAIIAEALARFHGDTLVRAAVASPQLHNELNAALAAQHPPLTVICLLTAFLVRVYAAQEPTAGHAGGEPLPAVHTDEQVADLSTRLLAAEADAQKQRDELWRIAKEHSDDLLRTRAFGTRALAWAVGLAITLIVVVSGILVLRLEAEWAVWFGFFTAVTGGAVVLLVYVGSRANTVHCEPHLLRWIRSVRSGG